MKEHIFGTPPLDWLGSDDGFTFYCKLCDFQTQHSTFPALTKTAPYRELVDHWKLKHKAEYDDLMSRIHGEKSTSD